MATDETIKQVIAINATLFPQFAPQDTSQALAIAIVWSNQLEPFTDQEVIAEVNLAIGSLEFPLRPNDIVKSLCRRRLGIKPWEEAFTEIKQAIARRDGSFRNLEDSLGKRVGESFVTVIGNATLDRISTIMAQFRDAYEAAATRLIASERTEGRLRIGTRPIPLADPPGQTTQPAASAPPILASGTVSALAAGCETPAPAARGGATNEWATKPRIVR